MRSPLAPARLEVSPEVGDDCSFLRVDTPQQLVLALKLRVLFAAARTL